MKNFYPCNGTEGEWFVEAYCNKCYKYHGCTIFTNSLFGKEPKQWIYNDENKPFCTSFNPNRPKRKKLSKEMTNLLFK